MTLEQLKNLQVGQYLNHIDGDINDLVLILDINTFKGKKQNYITLTLLQLSDLSKYSKEEFPGNIEDFDLSPLRYYNILTEEEAAKIVPLYQINQLKAQVL